jgi:hypothetical protein
VISPILYSSAAAPQVAAANNETAKAVPVNLFMIFLPGLAPACGSNANRTAVIKYRYLPIFKQKIDIFA